jgi:general secretion pathway protein E
MQTVQDTLGSLLVSKGLVTEEQIEEALDRQKNRGGDQRLGEILIDLEYVDENDVLGALSEALNVPFQPEISAEVDQSLVNRVPLQFIRKYSIVPFKIEDGICYVAVHDPLNLMPLDDLRVLLGITVRPVISRLDQIEGVIDHYFDQQIETAADVIDNLDEEDLSDILSPDDVPAEERDLLDLANEAPIIKIINLIISGAIKERASDIHIEPLEHDLRVRYRIDGVLYEVLSPPKAYQSAVISRIKIMSNMDIAERRLPQDGRIKIKLSGREIDIRVSCIPISHGERIVMRLLDKGAFLLNLGQLGLHEDDYTILRRLLRNPHGIVLVTGPTGSGKTTTLYAALGEINSMEKNVITVEDPIEYEMSGIGQMQVHEKIGLSFANALRSFVRQDPDVILVGEIRDRETAEMAVQAALTGHLVFSTVHTNDASGAVTRLVNMGIEPYLVSSSVIAIVAQRLVRVICRHCKESRPAEPAALKDLGLPPEALDGATVSEGKGCDACSGRGYLGRTGIYEILPITKHIQELVLSGADSNVIKRAALEEGMHTLRMDGARKVLEGVTTVEEVLSITREDIV